MVGTIVQALVERVALFACVLLAPFSGEIGVAKTLSVVAHALLNIFVAAWQRLVLDWVPVAANFFAGVARVPFLALALGGLPRATLFAGTVVVAFLFLKLVRSVDVLPPALARGDLAPRASEALPAHALPPAGLV